MEPAVMAALITGIFAIIGQWMITRSANKQAETKRTQDDEKKAVEQAVKDTELKNALASIEQRLVEHNGYAEKFAQMTSRFGEIEKAVVAIQKDMEYLKQKGA